jgi:hypothetical protein
VRQSRYQISKSKLCVCGQREQSIGANRDRNPTRIASALRVDQGGRGTRRVQIDKVGDEVVLVTTAYERTIKNKTKHNKPASAWYEAEDYKFPNGPTQIIECGIESHSEKCQSSEQTVRKRDVEVKTADLIVRPDGTARVWGKALQYRRINDVMSENFRLPIVNPEIEVIINEEEFSHEIAFGTYGDYTKSKYSNHYALSGVYFPGQFMWVRWWPKGSGTEATTLSPP